ncbi:MAG: hypothetical protein ACPGSJ_13395 [Pseudoalteromonas spongiae]
MEENVVKKYSVITLIIVLLGALIWFANFYSLPTPEIDHALPNTQITDEIILEQVKTAPEKAQTHTKTAIAEDSAKNSYCKDQTRYIAKFERDKKGYLSTLAVAWKLQGQNPQTIIHALETTVSKDAAQRFKRDLKLVSSFNESNLSKSQQYLNELTFNDYAKNKHRLHFLKWRQHAIKNDFIESYREQAERYPDIAADILQQAFLQAINIDNPKPDFDQLLLLYDSYYSLNPVPNKLITSHQLSYLLSGLTPDVANKVLSRLLLIEQLDSEETKSIVLARIGGINKQFAEIIKGATVSAKPVVESDELKTRIANIIEKEKLSLSEQNVCQLYDVAEIDSQINVTYVDASTLDYDHPSCDRLLSEQAKEIGMLALFSELSAQFLAAGIDLSNLNNAEQVKRADLTLIHEYLAKKPEFERELAYLLIYSRPMHSQRVAIIDALVTQGLYPKDANAVAVIQRLNSEDALRMLDRMGNIDKPNQRGESVVYNLMFINPSLTVELINQGYAQQHSERHPDPLLKMLHFLKENRASDQWISVVDALINNGAKLKARHLDEMYRIKLTLPEIYQKLIELHPELAAEKAGSLKVIQCQGVSDAH